MLAVINVTNFVVDFKQFDMTLFDVSMDYEAQFISTSAQLQCIQS